MPPNPERQARMKAKREEMANDPELQDAMRRAHESIGLGEEQRGVSDSVGGEYPRATPEPVVRPPAPPLSQPPIGKPMVGGEPAPPRAAPRGGMRGRGGGGGRPFAPSPPDTAMPAPLPITPQLRVDTNDPLGVGPKWKYAEGGSVKEAPPPPPRPPTRPGKIIVDTTTAASRSPMPRATRLQEEQVYRKGGPVQGLSFAKGGSADYFGKDYRKGK